MAKKSVSTLAVIAAIATAAMITVNYLAAAGILNGVETSAISDRYPTPITPAGYAFSIWSLIYLGTIVFAIFQLLPRWADKFNGLRLPYILSCILNCLWLVAWHHFMVIASATLIVVLLATLVVMLRSMREPATAMEALLTKGVFGLYAGWITAASLVNILIAMRSLDISLSDTAWQVIGVFCLAIAAAACILARLKLNNYFYPLAIAWAAAAIGIHQSGATAVVVASAVTMILGLVTAGSFVVTLPTRTHT